MPHAVFNKVARARLRLLAAPRFFAFARAADMLRCYFCFGGTARACCSSFAFRVCRRARIGGFFLPAPFPVMPTQAVCFSPPSSSSPSTRVLEQRYVISRPVALPQRVMQ